jgi:hypothetical protein
MGTYDTPVEKRDVALLESLGFKVTNPNTKEVAVAFTEYRNNILPENSYMKFFEDMAAAHDVLAFRGLPDGTIPAGVAKEIAAAKSAGKIVIEIPCGLTRRTLGLEATREYLMDMGER